MAKKEAKSRSTLAEARAWATRRKLFGAQAFLRYMILRFTENLNEVSSDFVFKGGNLLWVFIDTPRATTDLDLAMIKTHSPVRVREIIGQACSLGEAVRFSLLAFKELGADGQAGAALTIGYVTEQGANNRFEVDIVYDSATDSREINSPIHAEIKILSATIENIIADKLSSSERFRSGNTRMKDYDDLWRIAHSGREINSVTLAKLFKQKGVSGHLKEAWINPEMERAWLTHCGKYKDLPKGLPSVFGSVNDWLLRMLK